MRIAVFSDVHGNRLALEAVLQDIEEQKPDALANLGDQVWGGADPADALMLTRDAEAARPATLAEMVERTSAYSEAKVFVVGHTHTEMLFVRDGKTFVNAGAVSRQGYGDPAGRWVLLEERAGTWNVSFRRVLYDTEAAAQWALANCPIGEQEAKQLRTGIAGYGVLR